MNGDSQNRFPAWEWLAALLGFILFFCRATCAEAAPNFLTQVWLRENGLPQNTVTAVIQTQDGYLWLGTYNGLARFDGVRFVCYDSVNTAELGDSRITSLFEAKDGTLWIGHETGELTCYAAGHFKSVPMKVQWRQKEIKEIAQDDSGDLWLVNNEGLLARVRDGLMLTPETGNVPLVEVACSDRGQIWVSRFGRVSVLQGGQITPLSFKESRSNTLVLGIGASRDGGLWMQVDGELRKWRDDHWTEIRFPQPLDGPPLLRVLESRTGRLLTATSNHGLVLINPDGQVFLFSRTNGLVSDWVQAVCEDREGNFWAGTGGGGLARVRESGMQVITPPDGWKGRAILSLQADCNNAMWIGTEGAGLYCYKNETWTNVALKHSYCWSLAEDTDGRLWAGTWGGGLFVRKEGGFIPGPGLEDFILPVPALIPSRQGGLWIGTTEGLLRYDRTGNKTWFANDAAVAKREVRCILENSAGDIWFGTAGEGLFHLQNQSVEQFRKIDGLAGNFVRCLREGEGGAIWIGTSDGLCRYKGKRFSTVSIKQGLPDSIICCIEDDERGSFWISSNNGVFSINKNELEQCADGSVTAVHCQRFGMGDGLPSLESSGGGSRTADGRLWFSTSHGPVAINPLNVKTNPLAPPVLIEALRVDGNPISAPAAENRVIIPPGRHRFQFQYTGLSLAAPEKVRFRHRLEGMDSDWTEPEANRATEYNYVPPGNYTFRVIACNNDGVWNETGARMAFRVLPYFWQTGWFRALVLMAVVLSAGGGAWYTARRRMRLKLERLERQRTVERERTRIARDIHDDLGASLTRINLLSQAACRSADYLPPQTLKHLTQICTNAREVTRKMDEIVWAVNPQHDTFDSLITYLGKLIHELLLDSGIRYRLDFPGELPSWPLTAELRHNLFLACKEALHNVIKHSGASEVQISVVVQPAGFTVQIADNGHGFSSPPPSQSPSGDAFSPSRRNGLSNMRHRLSSSGGRCDIQSEPGHGTKVLFILPVSGGD